MTMAGGCVAFLFALAVDIQVVELLNFRQCVIVYNCYHIFYLNQLKHIYLSRVGLHK